MSARAIALAGALALSFGRCSQNADHGAHGGGPAASDAPVDHGAHAPGVPSGYAPITIDPSRVGPLGLTTATVAERDFTRVLRTVGVVTFDETRTAHVHTKVRGFIEGLPAAFVGKLVKAGEPLAAIYSQEVYAAQLEYLSLLEPPQVPGGESIVGGDAGMWQGTAEASRRRLLLWDVPKRQIEQLEKTRKATRTYTIFAPRSGTLVTKQATLGNFVEPGTELFTISDLALLWVLVDVYEDDVRFVRLGQQAKLAIQGLAEPVTAKIAFIAPTIDESTRTLKARLELPNSDRHLRPGAFATAEIELPLGRGVAVPESAIVRTGTRAITFVVHGAPGGALHVEPREISIGALIGGHYRVQSGLAVGDRVATGAQFLVDSESRLKASSTAGGPGGHGGH